MLVMIGYDDDDGPCASPTTPATACPARLRLPGPERDIARRIRTATSTSTAGVPTSGAPFGGYKQSGSGAVGAASVSRGVPRTKAM